MGRDVPFGEGQPLTSDLYRGCIADALKRDLGGSHRAIKSVMKWTGVSERSAKNWLAGTCGPSGEHLIRLMQHSPSVFCVVTDLSGHRDLRVSQRIDDARRCLSDAIDLLDRFVASNGNPHHALSGSRIANPADGVLRSSADRVGFGPRGERDMAFLNDAETGGLFVGRVWDASVSGPCVVTLREGRIVDITSQVAPTVSDICDLSYPGKYVRQASGRDLGSLEDIARAGEGAGLRFLAPCDLQVVKACGVTFASSMVERVIEEKAAGDPKRAAEIRARVGDMLGTSLNEIEAGSEAAAKVKAALIEEGLWSQYLEVGIGPDAEVFTKAPTLASVGPGAQVGLHPMSSWNNPEPEVVLAVSSSGRIVGATLGNDVNLRDVEGRSALLLSKAKDNNASCAVGPMIRLFDDHFDLDDVRTAELDLTVEGQDGFTLRGHSSMREISRDPADLVSQTIGRHHQYPDGFMLFLGTLFAPTQDRDVPGEGFTHKVGDIVTISAPGLGRLSNIVGLSTEIPEWTFGTRDLMRNLAERGLL